jgi:hypothetical protein
VSKPRIAILGAGPTGLEAALAAAEHGYPFTIYEASPDVAGHVRGWGHVRLFTPWSLNASERMRRALAEAGRPVPEDAGVCPTGSELVESLYEPLGRLLGDRLRRGVRVRRVGRRGLLKHDEIGTGKRAAHPFRLLLEDADGREWTEEADVVFDCSGNTEPNTLGDGGIPAPGEDALDGRIGREVPDLARDAEAWAGKTVLLVGAGHSAQTAVVDLVDLASAYPGTRIVWALRDEVPSPIPGDPLGERARLTGRAAALAAAPPPCLEVRRGAVVERVCANGRVSVELRRRDGARETVEVDRVLALTGRVGDHRLYRQLQVHECYATSGPMSLAAALLGQGGAGGDCLAQTSLGPETLKNPEPRFFILGAKSYGRRNDYLMRVGWQQVDEVFALLERG